MVYSDAEHPELSLYTVVFIPRKGGMSDRTIGKLLDIAGFILDVSKEFMNA